jgi:hypothetical protein
LGENWNAPNFPEDDLKAVGEHAMRATNLAKDGRATDANGSADAALPLRFCDCEEIAVPRAKPTAAPIPSWIMGY